MIVYNCISTNGWMREDEDKTCQNRDGNASSDLDEACTDRKTFCYNIERVPFYIVSSIGLNEITSMAVFSFRLQRTTLSSTER